MERPRYVERRLARLDAAYTAALALPDAALAAQIASERDLLRAAAGWEVSDRTVRAQGQQTLWRWFSLGQGARAKILSDPTLRALSEAARTTEALDLLLQIAPDGPSDDARLGRLQAALIAAGGVEAGAAAFDEALLAGYRDWFLAGPHPHQYPFDDLVVLLPVRLETYFPDANHLWLRVVPDEVSIRRDVPTVVPDEEAALNAFWSEALKANNLPGWSQSPAGLFDLAGTGVAWERLAARVTPQRAAWIVPTFPPTHDSLAVGRPVVEIPEERRAAASAFANHVAGFPQTIDVWAVWGGDPSLRRLTPSSPAVPIDPDRLVLGAERIDASRRHLAGEAIPVEDRAWWMDWDAAQAVGLGLTFDLPAGCTPTTLEALYVTGQSEEPPRELFRAHAEAGELVILPLGMPTNAVAGSQTDPAPSPDDPGTWRRAASQRLAQGPDAAGLTALLSSVVTGRRDALPPLPLDQDVLLEETPDMSFILSRALWPALRGHSWRDIFGMRDATEALHRWAQYNFAPEGPWCPIRIGDQPYGLLPVSVLAGWKVEPAPADPGAAVEEQLAAQLHPLRDAWARAARRTGTVRGRDAAAFLDLLGKDAMARRYAYRWFLPAEFFAVPYIVEGHLDPSATKLLQALQAAYERFDAMLGTGLPQRFYLTRGGASDLELSLVRATGWTERLQLATVIDNIARGMAAREALDIYFGHEAIPRSLLVRLLIHAAFTATGALGQEQEERRPGGQQLSLLNPLLWWTEWTTAVEDARKHFVAAQQTEDSDVLHHISFVADMLDAMQDVYRAPDSATAAQRAELARKEAGVERALRATLDTAAHRIDPWITGMAARRARVTADSASADYRLGIYGWLDGPFVGSAGPTDGGLLHTPSHAQTLTAVILRDKYMTSRLEGDADAANPWAMSLDSQSVRLADELAEEVRIGAHPYEALGRRVEQTVGTRQHVASLRQAFPLRPAAVPRDPNTVCDGLAALRGATLQAGTGGLYDQLDEHQRRRIDLLRRAADVYGDLLVAEAVCDVVSGRPDGANAAMEAAAGLGKPAGLEFVQTPDSGIALKSSVLSVLPAVADGPSTRPAAIADVSAAAWISAALATGWDWQVAWWKAGPPLAGAPPDATVTVALADMDLTPADAALLPENILNGIAVEIARVRLPALIAGLDVAGTATAHGEATAPGRHAEARGLVSLLGGPPATAEEFAPSGPATEAADVAWMTAVNSAIATELRGRYQRLRAAAQDLLARLEIPGLPKLREALLWGLLPGSAPDAQANALALLYGHVHDGALMTALAQAATTALKHRLDAAPAAEPTAAPTTTNLSERDLRRPQEIARAIAELGSADGHMAVLARIDRTTFAAQCELAPDPTLETDWLTTVAAVRRDLARVEAWNLEAGIEKVLPVLVPFSNMPGDPWQQNAAAKVAAARAEGVAPGGQRTRPWTPHLVAAFADPAWQAATTIAVGLVDGWTETVPTLRRSTRAALGFNAPAARAPQAILLAVPPVARTWLSPETLAAIVADARTLTHARGARLEDLAADYRAQLTANPGDPPVPYQDLRATMMLQTPPLTGIDLVDRPWWD